MAVDTEARTSAVSPEIRRKRLEARLAVARIIAERKMQERTTRT